MVSLTWQQAYFYPRLTICKHCEKIVLGIGPDIVNKLPNLLRIQPKSSKNKYPFGAASRPAKNVLDRLGLDSHKIWQYVDKGHMIKSIFSKYFAHF